MKKILITGGNGFVGIYFAKKLFNNNVKLDIVDITEQRHIYCSEYFKKDCRDFFKNNKLYYYSYYYYYYIRSIDTKLN